MQSQPVPKLRIKDTVPIRVTDTGLLVLQVRLSLRETKTQFAKRFLVARKTIHFWETGQSLTIGRLFQEALFRMQRQLMEAKMLVPIEVVQLEFQKIIEKRGDAMDILNDSPRVTPAYVKLDATSPASSPRSPASQLDK